MNLTDLSGLVLWHNLIMFQILSHVGPSTMAGIWDEDGEVDHMTCTCNQSSIWYLGKFGERQTIIIKQINLGKKEKTNGYLIFTINLTTQIDIYKLLQTTQKICFATGAQPTVSESQETEPDRHYSLHLTAWQPWGHHETTELSALHHI